LSVLMLDKDMPLPGDQPIAELGLDSLMALEIKNVLQSAAGAALPSTFLFDYPTLDQAVGFLSTLIAANSSDAIEKTDPAGYEEIVL
jgi:acyl carrier protein